MDTAISLPKICAATRQAFRNGEWIINFEAPHTLWELTFQRMLQSSDALMTAATWTYWGSQFTVLGIALLWAYLRHNDAFYKFRNAIMLANLIVDALDNKRQF